MICFTNPTSLAVAGYQKLLLSTVVTLNHIYLRLFVTYIDRRVRMAGWKHNNKKGDKVIPIIITITIKVPQTEGRAGSGMALEPCNETRLCPLLARSDNA